MSDYQFSNSERYAIYVAHHEKCYMCSAPLDLKTMEVDHIIPEHLLKNEAQLTAVLESLGLPNNFDLNSYSNWAPTCRTCNGTKRELVFNPSLLIQTQLQRAEERAKRACSLEAETVSSRKIQNALNTLKRADEAGDLDLKTKQELEPLIEWTYSHREREIQSEEIRLTPNYRVVAEDNHNQYIEGPYGVGRRPKGNDLHHSWDCIHCGSIAAWSGVRCVMCGQMDDD